MSVRWGDAVCVCLWGAGRATITGVQCARGFYRLITAYSTPHARIDVPGVFQSPFQSAPLDLDTDAFFPARAAVIEARLQQIALGGAGEH